MGPGSSWLGGPLLARDGKEEVSNLRKLRNREFDKIKYNFTKSPPFSTVLHFALLVKCWKTWVVGRFYGWEISGKLKTSQEVIFATLKNNFEMQESATIFISHSQTSEWSKLYQTQFTSSEVVKYGVPARLKKTILAIYPKCMHCSQGTSKCLETYPQKTQTILLISSRYRDTCWSQYQYRFFTTLSCILSIIINISHT